MLTILAFWLLVLTTIVTAAVLYRPRAIRTVPAVTEPRSHVSLLRRSAPVAPVVALGERRRARATRRTA